MKYLFLIGAFFMLPALASEMSPHQTGWGNTEFKGEKFKYRVYDFKAIKEIDHEFIYVCEGRAFHLKDKKAIRMFQWALAEQGRFHSNFLELYRNATIRDYRTEMSALKPHYVIKCYGLFESIVDIEKSTRPKY